MSTMRTDQIGARELAIGLHVIMKESPNWTRFENHKISDDRKSIEITLDDGRRFTVEVHEADQGRPYDLAILIALMNLLPELATLDEIHAALVSYVNLWRGGDA
jgi:hypothetical protein